MEMWVIASLFQNLSRSIAIFYGQFPCALILKFMPSLPFTHHTKPLVSSQQIQTLHRNIALWISSYSHATKPNHVPLHPANKDFSNDLRHSGARGAHAIIWKIWGPERGRATLPRSKARVACCGRILSIWSHCVSEGVSPLPGGHAEGSARSEAEVFVSGPHTSVWGACTLSQKSSTCRPAILLHI
jgi:hypothetical protein